MKREKNLALIPKNRFTLQMNVAHKKCKLSLSVMRECYEVIKNPVQPDAQISFLKGLAMTLQLSSNSGTHRVSSAAL